VDQITTHYRSAVFFCNWLILGFCASVLPLLLVLLWSALLHCILKRSHYIMLVILDIPAAFADMPNLEILNLFNNNIEVCKKDVSDDIILPHHGQPPCCGGGAFHRWPERFLKSGGEELTKSWPNPWEQICYTLPVLLCWFRLHSRLRLYSRLFTAS